MFDTSLLATLTTEQRKALAVLAVKKQRQAIGACSIAEAYSRAWPIFKVALEYNTWRKWN